VTRRTKRTLVTIGHVPLIAVYTIICIATYEKYRAVFCLMLLMAPVVTYFYTDWADGFVKGKAKHRRN